jgi:hypothetical protein
MIEPAAVHGKTMKAGAAAALLLALTAATATAEQLPPGAPESREYVAEPPRFDQPPVLDGKLDDPVWQHALVLKDFLQYEPNPGQPATEPTEVRIGYDTHNLYFGIRCFDSEAGKIISKVMTHDSDLSFEDSVQILLDTFHDRNNAFLFSFNPSGAKVEGEVRRQGDEVNLDWDGIWDLATSRDDKGWTAEVKIPFKTLRFPAGKPQLWGFNVQRLIPRKQEDSWWKPPPRGNGVLGRYSFPHYGELQGMEGITPGSRYEAVPYSLARGERPDQRSSAANGRAGGDLKMSLTSNLILDLTLNTDFAETEADLQQVNFSRVKLFYPEKRAFFLEGANLFYVGDRGERYGATEQFYLFYSRQIGLTEDGLHEIPVLGGAKLSGEYKGIGIGALNLTTDADSFGGAGGQPVTEPRTNYSVLRLRKRIFGDSSIGFMGLNKDPGNGDTNRTLGVDWSLLFTPSLSSTGFVAQTSTPGLTGDDHAASADLLYRGGRIRAFTVYYDIGRNFNDEMGFVTRTGVRRSQSDFAWFFFPDWGPLHRGSFINNLDHVVDENGRLQSQIWKTEATFVLQNSAGLALLTFDDLEILDQPFLVHKGVVIPPGTYRFRNLFLGWATDYSRSLGATFWYDNGEYYNGRRLRTLVAPIWKPFPGLEIDGQWDRTRVTLPAGDFTTVISWLQVVYDFSPTLSTHTLVQWNREDNLQTNLLLDWTFRPGSDLFLIYKGIRDLDTLRRDSGQSLLDPGKSFSVKVRYRFDF